MVNSDPQDTGSNIPHKTHLKSRFRKSILYSVIAVIVVMIVVVSVAVVLPYSSNPHFGFMSLSTVQKFTNASLTESKVIFMNLYVYPSENLSKNFLLTRNYSSQYPPVLVQGIYFNSTNGSGSIGIGVYKFPYSYLAKEFYDGASSIIPNYTILSIGEDAGHNLTFDGFKYSFYSSLNLSMVSMGFAYEDSFFLSIFDQGIPIDNFNGFIQAQISAMS